MLKYVAVWFHPEKPEASALARRLKSMLVRRVSVVPLARAQVIFVLGGDGSILSMAPKAARLGVPIVAVNVGRVGFLTKFTARNIFSGLSAILQGKFRIEERRMIDVWKEQRGRKPVRLGTALNEMLLVREGMSRIPDVSITIGGESAGMFGADGVIVSTPTGSTGHALAAGGPVLSPEMHALLVVPICPHPPRVRPIVVEEKEVTVTWSGGHIDMQVRLDGRRVHRLRSGPAIIRVRPSERSAQFVCLTHLSSPRSFFDVVRKKLI